MLTLWQSYGKVRKYLYIPRVNISWHLTWGCKKSMRTSFLLGNKKLRYKGSLIIFIKKQVPIMKINSIYYYFSVNNEKVNEWYLMFTEHSIRKRLKIYRSWIGYSTFIVPTCENIFIIRDISMENFMEMFALLCLINKPMCHQPKKS